MKRFSDREILENITKDDEEVYEFVFLTFYNELCVYALGILREASASEEIVQEVFVKLWENRKELSIKTSVKAYLYRSVHNLCINYIDHQQVTRKYAAESGLNYRDVVSPVSSDYPIANLLVQELEDKIDRALSELPAQCREVFLLVRREDLSYQEVAEKLGVSVNTVKTQLQRSVGRLRESLKDYLPVVLVGVLGIGCWVLGMGS